jgi:hypothetical protein
VASSTPWIDRPVTLPPGRDKLATKPLPSGSNPKTKTIGMTDVACLAAAAASPPVTMTSTLRRTNSAAIPKEIGRMQGATVKASEPT